MRSEESDEPANGRAAASIASTSTRPSELSAAPASALTDAETGVSDEEEEEDDEPLLKYSRIGGATQQIFDKDSASSLAVSDKYIVIGTHSGHLFILNHQGDFVKRFKPHAATVQAIDIDETSGFIATASMDGKCSVVELSIPEMSVYDMHRPMRAISLEPGFGHRTARQFVCGGMGGKLILHEKGWLGSKETTLHSGEGPIWAVNWRGNFIAWANDEGVGLYDTTASKRTTFIRREPDSPRTDLFKCTLFWQSDKKLLVAWADMLKVVTIKERIDRSRGQLGLTGATTMVGEVTLALQLDAMISSIAPFKKDSYILLAYSTEDSYGKEATEDYAQQKRKEAQRPELRIISTAGEELSMDELSLTGYARNLCSDYSLAPSKVDNSYIVLSPRDGLVARPRDASDHITWLLERKRYEDALKAVAKLDSSRRANFDELDIGKRYLEHLIQQDHFSEAAEQCTRIFGQNIKAWEDWIFLFIERGKISSIVPYIPTGEPQLGHVVYEMVLAHFLRTDQEALLRMIRTWPHEIYDVEAVISAVDGALDSDKSSVVLMDCLTDLYLLNRQYAKALPLFLRLRRPGVFDLIRDHNLFTSVQDQALALIEFERDLAKGKGKDVVNGGPVIAPTEPASPHGAAIDLLVSNTHAIPLPRVVKQLSSHRLYLFMYLDALFDRDPHLAFDYSDLQVDLYAEYDYSKLMDFLRASNYYSLEKAYGICKDRDLVPEMVFLLGRMGNNKQALSLIIERLDDVQRAIVFAKEQADQDLWEDLLKYSETRPRFIRGLLENVGADIDPVKLIRRIKNGLEIPGLKPALIKILQDFNLQITLMNGCGSILFADCHALDMQLHEGQASAFLGSPEDPCQHCGKPAFTVADPARATSEKAIALIFLCRHVYHAGCAFPDEELPPRPQHAIVPSSLLDDKQRQSDSAKTIDARIRFAATLRSRVKTKCPACSHVKKA